jgi:adenylyltransferase/sulfurtransferase
VRRGRRARRPARDHRLAPGDPLVGRLLLFDAQSATFTEVALRKDPNCPVCGDSPTITEYIDYAEFCRVGA